MYIEFDKISENARLWIYQANRTLNPEESQWLETQLAQILEKWTAHGAGLLASAKLLENRFLLIATDEDHHTASGCSIDSSVRWVQELGTTLGVDFMDRSVVYRNGDELKTANPLKIKNAVQANEIEAETLIYDTTLLKTKADLEHFGTKANGTWLKKYF